MIKIVKEALNLQNNNQLLRRELCRRSFIFSYLWNNKFEDPQAKEALNNFISNIKDECFQLALAQSLYSVRKVDKFIEDNIEVWEDLCRYCIWGDGEVETSIPEEVRKEALNVSSRLSISRLEVGTIIE